MSINRHLPSQSAAWFYSPCVLRCQSPELLETELRVSRFPQPPPTHQSPDLFFPHHHHHWPRSLFPKDLFLATFPAPWEHILASGSYPHRKGQTLSRGTHDPPKNTLTPTRGYLQSSIIVQPTATIPPWASLQALPILENASHARRGTGEGTVQSHKTSLYGPPTLLGPRTHHCEPQTTSLFLKDKLLSLCL